MMLGCLKDWIRKGMRERGKLSSPLPLISDVSEISNIECTSRIYPTCVWERVDRRAQRRRAGRGVALSTYADPQTPLPPRSLSAARHPLPQPKSGLSDFGT